MSRLNLPSGAAGVEIGGGCRDRLRSCCGVSQRVQQRCLLPRDQFLQHCAAVGDGRPLDCSCRYNGMTSSTNPQGATEAIKPSSNSIMNDPFTGDTSSDT